MRFRCKLCRNRNHKYRITDPVSPLLVSMERVDPDWDDEWEYLVCKRKSHIGAKHADDLAETRTRAWWRAGGRGSDPGPRFAGRDREVDMAVVDLRNKTAGGWDWASTPDIPCPRCGHLPKGLTLGIMAETAQKRALQGRSTLYV